MATNTYLEGTDDNSQSTFAFTHEGGAASGVYQFDDVESVDDLQGAITDILGFTETGTNPSRSLRRTLPCTHPAFPYLYATNITGMLGMGSADAERVQEVVPPLTGNPQAIADTFNLYPTYQIRCNFGTRPYTILPDSQVMVYQSSWWPDGVLATAPATTFSVAAEWVRYTDYEIAPQNNTIQGQSGMFVFRAPTKPAVDGKNFTSPPWMYLPDSILKFTWYQVPYRYVISSNSYIANRGWLGRINQNAWYNWPAGSLLYLNYNVKKYNQPALGTERFIDQDGNDWTSYAKLCDIEFTFLYTTRPAPQFYPTPKYGNWIPAGHNLLPFLGSAGAGVNRGFWYATNASTDEEQWVPAWSSFPLEALFSDPDTAGGP